jgi:hypothetical protein
MRASWGLKFENISATTADFKIEIPGTYSILITGTFNGGSYVLQQLAGDGTTYVNMHTAISANGRTTAVCGVGTYRFLEAGATSAMYISLDRVPGE